MNQITNSNDIINFKTELSAIEALCAKHNTLKHHTPPRIKKKLVQLKIRIMMRIKLQHENLSGARRKANKTDDYKKQKIK